MAYDYFYHYTNERSLKSIFARHSDGVNDNGLQPDRRFIRIGDARGLPDKAHDVAIWGMLSPRPEEYTDTYWHEYGSFFSDCLEHARQHLKPTFMLRAAVTPEDDIYVADWGVHLRDDYFGYRDTDEAVLHETKTAYWNSLIPLQDYKEGTHTLPEVICFSHVPVERLAVQAVIPSSEMDRYIKTGRFDPAALVQDMQKEQERERRISDFIQGL